MPTTNQTAGPEIRADQLTRLAEMLGVEIAPEHLAALANQLKLIDELEQSELQDYPPILKMDADWHD